MSDIKLSLDGAEENDPKLEAITSDSPDLIENKITFSEAEEKMIDAVSYTHLTLPTIAAECRSRWSPYH